MDEIERVLEEVREVVRREGPPVVSTLSALAAAGEAARLPSAIADPEKLAIGCVAAVVAAVAKARAGGLPTPPLEAFEACFRARGPIRDVAFQALLGIPATYVVDAGWEAYTKWGNGDRLDLVARLLVAYGERASIAWVRLANRPCPFERFLGALEQSTWLDAHDKRALIGFALQQNADQHTRTCLREALDNDGPGMFWATWVNGNGRTCTVGDSAPCMDDAPDRILIEAFRGHVPDIPSGRVFIRRGETYDVTGPAVEYEIRHVRERILARRV
jgi:hypothetical protein